MIRFYLLLVFAIILFPFLPFPARIAATAMGRKA